MKKGDFKKGIFYKIVLGCFIFLVVCVVSHSLVTKEASALNRINYPELYKLDSIEQAMVLQAIEVGDKESMAELEELGLVEEIGWYENAFMFFDKWKEDGLAATVFKEALGKFLNDIAYNSATYLASGNKGQKPMFITEGWGEYLKNVGDNAAGKFIEDWGKATGYNLCEPSLNVKLKVSLGLKEMYRPKKPKCTFSEMRNNWDEEISRDDFLNRFQTMFNPTSNDLGISLTAFANINKEVEKEVNQKYIAREVNKGFKDVTSDISNEIVLPATFTRARGDKIMYDSDFKEKTFTGNILADAIGVFGSTLMGKLIDKLFNEGLVSSSPNNSYDWDSLNFSNPDSASFSEGIAGAKERFRSLVEPEFGVRGDYEILNELTKCLNPTKAGPTNCVITEKFRDSIINKMTVGNAMREGYLNPNGIFGFATDGIEPAYNEGYPYRSIIILRKFRILPVGWELASQYIKDNPQQESLGGTGGIKNLEDLVNCFADDDDYGELADTFSWCEGLVDPDWVLKAPLNYCKREGPGPEIYSENVIGQGSDSKISISRNENYCADEQSCIQENDDGSCNLYGYCSKERRKWQFNGKSCDPKYNTCETYRGREGQTASYLENTLDFGTCNIGNIGCTDYCEDYDFASSTYECTVSEGDKLYLDRNAEMCDIDAEGCHESIRTKTGLGSNLLKNSSFEKIDALDLVDDGAPDTFDYWSPGISGEAIGEGFVGNTSIQLNAQFNGVVAIETPLFDYNVSYQKYTLSFYAKHCGTLSEFALGDLTATTSMGDVTGDNWRYFNIDYVYPATISSLISFTINPDGANCKIDAIKLEYGDKPTAYSDYREKGLIYQKLAPAYLNCTGANTDPVECDDYVRYCTFDDLGCTLYTSVTDDLSVPGKVIPNDYCAAECVGYDNYFQDYTYFDSLTTDNFIPRTAKSCSAEAVGCDEFTNLDKMDEGGEAREYYSRLRQCVKPSDPSSNCADFYTWEGSNETGYQLRVFGMEQDIAGGPAVISDDSAYCSSPEDMLTNSDCREFYNNAGNVYYHLYSYTITCSENCHPYRRTDKNVDNSGGCVGADRGIDSNTGDCVVCINGGVWNTEHNSCIYMAIPGEGKKCSASQAGCREYTGNTSNNIRVVLTNDFEAGTTDGWTGDIDPDLNPSNNSLRVGGHSLEITDFDPVDGSFEITKQLGGLVREGSAYVLQFIANAPVNLSARIENSASTTDFLSSISTIPTPGEWDVYELNMTFLDHRAVSDESLVIESTGDFNIDDIKLIEIVDRYYLIKNSWNTPDSCFADIFGNYIGTDFSLGCDEYRDLENATHYLHNFDELCDESVVGCELMIDTHNYSDYNGASFNNEALPTDDDEVIPDDEYNYIVYDNNKSCLSADKGCQRLGDPYQYESNVVYGDVYLKNNPDKYSDILCQADEVNCEEWSSQDGSAFFKDPGDQICEWRQLYAAGAGNFGWYKKKVMRCDDGFGAGSSINGVIDTLEVNLCTDDSDCYVTGAACIVDDNDYACNTVDSPIKTIGIGGSGNIVRTPNEDIDGNWAGLCPASESGCAELIDPNSQFNYNKIFNPNFSDIDGDGTFADGWLGVNPWIQAVLNIKPYTLYKLGGEGNAGAILTLDCTNNLSIVDGNNNVVVSSAPASEVSLTLTAQPRNILVYSGNNTSCDISITGALAGSVEFKQAILVYQLVQDLDDTTCNGQVNFDDGCVLFNERNIVSGSSTAYNYQTLSYDSANSPLLNGTPSGCSGSDCDSNTIIKVSPDRDCAEWLACRSFIKDKNNDNVCFDIGLCDSVDENGNCNSYVIADQINQTYPDLVSADLVSNMSGYAKIGISSSVLENDYYPLGYMEQDGEIANIANAGFEFYGSNGYPIGWRPFNDTWDDNKFSVINNPIRAQVEGIKYPVEGNSFLKLSSENAFSSPYSEFIDVEPNTDYIISTYINTINFHSKNDNDVYFYISVNPFNSSGNDVFNGIYNYKTSNNSEAIINHVDPGQDWQFYSERFRTGANVSRIKLQMPSAAYDIGDCGNLPGIDNCAGNIYIDDIKIKPSLKIKDNTPFNAVDNNFLYVPQTCRLYPENDSLSCEYYEDSWKIKKGWLGYCLEYDRYPGSTDACLLWYPIDKIKGEGIEEGAGYTGKFPVYYCTESEEEILEQVSGNLGGSCSDWGSCTAVAERPITDFINIPPLGKVLDIRDLEVSATYRHPYQYVDVEMHLSIENINESVSFDDDYGTEKTESWGISYNGETRMVRAYGEAAGWDDNNVRVRGLRVEFTKIGRRCTEIRQTVNSVGQNKFWQARVNKGSNYSMPVNDVMDDEYDPWFVPVTQAIYITDSAPFGSIYPPYPVNNPYEWDADEEIAGNQPLMYYKTKFSYRPEGDDGNILVEAEENNYDRARSGQFVNDDNLSRLFAQSYGTWRWQDRHCEEGSNDGEACYTDVDCQPSCSNHCYAEIDGDPVIGGICAETNECAFEVEGTCIDNVCDGGCLHGVDCSLNGDEDCMNGFCSNSTNLCVGGFNNGVGCATDANCIIPNCFICDDNTMFCGGASTMICTNNIDCAGVCSEGASAGLYMPFEGEEWTPPATLCNEATRPEFPNDYCTILPQVVNIKVENEIINNIFISRNGFVNLEFNSIVDVQQLPLIMYDIDWGDNEKMKVSGVEMRDRPNVNNPHSLYHLYIYWELKAKNSIDQTLAGDANTVYCGDAGNDTAFNFNDVPLVLSVTPSSNYCAVQPGVKIRDNWGWCNNGEDNNPCPPDGYESFNEWIIVLER